MRPAHFLLMVVVCFGWGSGVAAGKLALLEFPPVFFLAIRFALLVVLLAPFIKPVVGSMRDMMWIAMLMGWGHLGLFYGGLALAGNISAVSIVSQTGVPIATIMSVIFLHEKIGWRRGLGILLAFVGVGLISFDPAIVNERLALLAVLASQILAAAGVIMMKRIKNVGVYQLQGWIAVFSVPPLAVLSLLFDAAHLAVLQAASLAAWGGLIYTVVAATLVGHAGMYYLLQKYDVSLVQPLTLMAPVIAILCGVFWWGDAFGAVLALGGAATLLGVLIVALRSEQPVKVTP